MTLKEVACSVSLIITFYEKDELFENYKVFVVEKIIFWQIHSNGAVGGTHQFPK